VFDLAFTFTPAGGTPESFLNQDSRLMGQTQTICRRYGSQSDAAGDTFAISGTVAGRLS
jgi:hypothetical protein